MGYSETHGIPRNKHFFPRNNKNRSAEFFRNGISMATLAVPICRRGGVAVQHAHQRGLPVPERDQARPQVCHASSCHGRQLLFPPERRKIRRERGKAGSYSNCVGWLVWSSEPSLGDHFNFFKKNFCNCTVVHFCIILDCFFFVFF